MRLCSFASVMRCLKRVGVGAMRVMSRLLGMPGSVLHRCFLVVLHRVLVVLGRLGMVTVGGMLAVRGFLSHA